jgi:hypothetical protein
MLLWQRPVQMGSVDVRCQDLRLPPVVVQAKVLVQFLKVRCHHLLREAGLVLKPQVKLELYPPDHVDWNEQLSGQLGLKLGSLCFSGGSEGIKLHRESMVGSKAGVQYHPICIKGDAHLDTGPLHVNLLQGGQGYTIFEVGCFPLQQHGMLRGL